MTGAIRPSKWAKYLPKFGWRPYVLTVDKIFGDPRDFPIDVPESNVIRTKFLDFWKYYNKLVKLLISRRNLTSNVQHTNVNPKEARELQPRLTISSTTRIPDRATGWIPFAFVKGLMILHQKRIHVILSTSGPPSNHIIGWALHKLSGVPWIADYRDPWYSNVLTRQIKELDHFEKWLEMFIIRDACLITTVSDGTRGNLSKFHGRNVEVVTNGFDPDDYIGILSPDRNGQLIITYTGSIDPVYRDPSMLFEAVASLKKRKVISSGDFGLRFYGSAEPWITRLSVDYGIEDLVVDGGIVSRSKSIECQATATAVLVIDTFGTKDTSENLPTKLFDYIGLKRPVLAVAPHDSQIDKFLRFTYAGTVCSSVSEIENILEDWISQFENSGKITFDGNPDRIKMYTREMQTEKMATLLNRALTASPHRP